jgi:methyl-accepting chemotaxis protein
VRRSSRANAAGEILRIMDFFLNLSIRGKVLAAFASILLFSVTLGMFAITRVQYLNAHAAALAVNAQVALPLGVMDKDAHELDRLTGQRHILATLSPVLQASEAPGALQELNNAIAATQQDFASQWQVYAPTMDPGHETDDGNRFNQAFNQLAAIASQVARYDDQGDHGDAYNLLTSGMETLLRHFDQAMNDDLAYQANQTTQFAREASDASTAGIIWIFAALLLMAAATLAVGWLIVRSIASPIAQMTDAMRDLAQQTMNVRIPGIGRRDEIGAMAAAVQVFKENGQERIRLEAEAAQFQQELDRKLKDMEAAFESAGRDQKLVVEGLASALSALAKGDLTARLSQQVAAAYQALKGDFNAAMDKLQDTMTSVAATTHTVHAGAGEISSASDDLSRRTERQAATLEQTAAALGEITATVRKTAEGAGTARSVATESKQDAEHSGNVVHETVQAMSQIDHSSKEISNIIGVIDEIAFQTNLLALNAGVEAARAGDAGRGFAVVATEVRALAQRSADAAKEIKTLISASHQQVKTGVRLVDDTGTALARIAGQVSRLNELIAAIAASAEEQATALHQVNSAVNQMDQVTQQNAAMVEQSTAASHSLSRDAAELSRLVGQFNLGEMALSAPRAAPRRPAASPAPRPAAAKHPARAGAQDESWDEF